MKKISPNWTKGTGIECEVILKMTLVSLQNDSFL